MVYRRPFWYVPMFSVQNILTYLKSVSSFSERYLYQPNQISGHILLVLIFLSFFPFFPFSFFFSFIYTYIYFTFLSPFFSLFPLSTLSPSRFFPYISDSLSTCASFILVPTTLNSTQRFDRSVLFFGYQKNISCLISNILFGAIFRYTGVVN